MSNQFQVTGFSKVVQFDTSKAKSTKSARTKQLQFTAKLEHGQSYTARSLCQDAKTLSLLDICHQAFIEQFGEYPVSVAVSVQTNAISDSTRLIVITITGRTNQIL